MDASDTRRGQPAMHRRFAAMHREAGWSGPSDGFGAAAAILIGDLLLAWTDELLRDSGLPDDAVLRGLTVLDPMRTEVLAGQYLDVVAQAMASSDLDRALRVVTYKSAKYTVERPLHLGAALAPAGQSAGRAAGTGTGPDGSLPRPDGTVASALTGYGIPVGIAFQLRDDILGVFGDPAQTGKPVTDDLREGKRTVLLAIAAERADAVQAKVLAASIGDPALTAGGAEQVREVIVATGALAECETMIEAKGAAGLGALTAAPIAADARDALAELAIAATSRLH